jgi:hypothetical protein
MNVYTAMVQYVAVMYVYTAMRRGWTQAMAGCPITDAAAALLKLLLQLLRLVWGGAAAAAAATTAAAGLRLLLLRRRRRRLRLLLQLLLRLIVLTTIATGMGRGWTQATAGCSASRSAAARRAHVSVATTSFRSAAAAGRC